MSLKKVKPYTIFVPGVKPIQTKKIAIGFFCPMGFLKADMSLKSSHGVLKFGYSDFLLGGIERWVWRVSTTDVDCAWAKDDEWSFAELRGLPKTVQTTPGADDGATSGCARDGGDAVSELWNRRVRSFSG